MLKQGLFDPLSKGDWRTRALTLMAFAFPILITNIHHAGGTILGVLVIAGLVYGWPAWNMLAPWEKRLLQGFLALFALMSLSLVNTDDWDMSGKKLEKLLHFVLFIPAYLAVRRANVPLGPAFLAGSLVGAFVLLAVALYTTTMLGQDRADSAYYAILFGDVAVLLACVITAALVTLPLPRYQRVIGGVAVAAAVYASLLSQTRGGWPMIPGAAAMLLWFYRDRISRKQWTAMILAVALVGGVVTVKQPAFVQHLESGVAGIKTFLTHPEAAMSSWGVRLNMWRDSLIIWRTAPVFGSGLGDFRHDSAELMNAGISPKHKAYDHAHSIIFDALATTGIVGLFGVIAFFILRPLRIFYRLFRLADDPQLRFYALAGVLCVSAFAVFGLSEALLSRNPFVRTYLFFILVLASGMAMTLARRDDKSTSKVRLNKVLVVRNDKLGDFMLAYPAFALLKQSLPGVQVHALVPAYTRDMAEACPWIDKVVIDRREQGFGGLIKSVAGERYDAAITLFSTTRIGILLSLARVPYRLAPATKVAQIFYNNRLRQRRSRSIKPEFEYNRDLVGHFLKDWGIDAAPAAQPPLLTVPDSDARALRRAFCQEHSVDPAHKLIFIHPGHGGSATNLSVEQFATLGRDLKSANGHTIIVSAGPSELDVARQLVDALRREGIVAVLYFSQDGLRGFAEHLQLADLFISGSTGPLHIAGALDRPTAGFYPRTRVMSPLRWQTLNGPANRLAFTPPEDAAETDMQRIDLSRAAAQISARFL